MILREEGFYWIDWAPPIPSSPQVAYWMGGKWEIAGDEARHDNSETIVLSPMLVKP